MLKIDVTEDYLKLKYILANDVILGELHKPSEFYDTDCSTITRSHQEIEAFGRQFQAH